MYIKSPASTERKREDDDFFTSLATSLISQIPNQMTQSNRKQYKYELSDRKIKDDVYVRNDEKNGSLGNAFQAEIELKNHEIGVISG